MDTPALIRISRALPGYPRYFIETCITSHGDYQAIYYSAPGQDSPRVITDHGDREWRGDSLPLAGVLRRTACYVELSRDRLLDRLGPNHPFFRS